jgi:phage/plasmid-like protein (TIGR03299 family)
MSHEIEVVDGVAKTMFAGETPWHGLGQRIEEEHRYDIEPGMKAAGLDTEVGLMKLMTEDGREVPERYTYRTSDKSLFGCVGSRYVPLQNRDAFKFFQPWLDTRMVALESAGSLFFGKKVWVLAQIMNADAEIRPNDEVKAYVMLSNSHDGTTAVRVSLTPIRVVCANTLAMAHASQDSKFIRIKHTQSVNVNLERIRDIIDLAKNEFVATSEQFRYLANKDICQADLNRYVRVMFGVGNTPTEDISTRMTNMMDKVYARFAEEEPVAGATWWNAANSYNYYLCHIAGKNPEKRLDSLWFGVNAALNQSAFNTALEMAYGK